MTTGHCDIIWMKNICPKTARNWLPNIATNLVAVNVLKFLTLFSFCSQLKCWNYQNACQNSKQGRPWSDCFFRSSLIWICAVCLGVFDRVLVYKILEHFLYTYCSWINHMFKIISLLEVAEIRNEFSISGNILLIVKLEHTWNKVWKSQ